MKCTKCGAKYEAKFCPECGEPSTGNSQAQTNTKFCKFCGGKVPLEAVVCTLCGR